LDVTIVAISAWAEAAEPSDLSVRSELTNRGGSVLVIAPIDAPPDVVVEVILDIEGRAPDMRDIRSGSVYGRSGDTTYAAYNLAIMGMSHWFHLRIVADRAAGTVRFDLDPDPSARNDVEHMDGSYTIVASDTGSVLTYAMNVDVGYYVPGFIRQRLVVARATEEIEGIARRAEEASRDR
jgi:hypothetical protein